MAITPELYEFIVKVVEDKVRDIKVTREEFDALRRSVEERLERLAEAQQRTEERLARLAEAQARTEARLEELAKAQALTEKRLEELAKAQARTEARLEELAEAQRRTEERLEQLAKAQVEVEERLGRLEAVVEKLAGAVDALRVEVGRLSETIGFGLEDVARAMLPGWLYRRLSVDVRELRREFFTVEGREVEVNLYGEGVLEGEKVVVIGEAKSRIYESDVDRFYHTVYAPVSRLAKAKAIGVLVGYLVHPSARRRAEELGLHVAAAYEGSR